jgi:putative iron-dependent peroxidase
MSSSFQPWVLELTPSVGAFYVYDLRPGADVRAALLRLRGAVRPSDGTVGLGAPLVKALGASVAGLRAFPALDGSTAKFPSTQGAVWVFAPGKEAVDVYDRGHAIREALGDGFALTEEVPVFRYRDGRDLMGFIDGTANPVDEEALEAAVLKGAGPGLDGSSFVAAQKYIHDVEGFHKLPPAARDDVFGRRHSDNEEMEDAPESAHVKRTEQEHFKPSGFMVRRSMPWGGVAQKGLYFVAYGESLDRFERTLRRMAGLEDGVTDAMLSFTRATSGGYYWCPPVRDGVLDLRALGL